jgi:hypothetical protein
MFAEAMAAFHGPQYGVGFALCPDRAKVAVIDIDGCRDAQVGEISPWAQALITLLPGAYVEISVSGRGLHIWFSYTGELPAHSCRANGIELYSRERFIALGSPYSAPGFTNGNASVDMTAVLPALIAMFFPTNTATRKASEWTEGHCKGWTLPDDDELIARALRFNDDADTAFGKKVSFSDLYTRNVSKLAQAYPDDRREYDESKADLALASKFAWLTGNDCPRIERLMWKSALPRDKWTTHKTYLSEFTIPRALVQDDNFYDPSYGKKSSGVPAPLTVPAGTPDELTPEDFWAHLPTHTYINRRNRESYSVEAVNGHLKRFSDQLGMKPALWLDMFRAVQQMSWQPGHGEIIEGMVAIAGILKPDVKGRILNLFHPSDAVASEGDASPWLDHVRRLYPDDVEHLLKWMAFRIQNPGKKINHAIVLGGSHGIGKDLMLEPLRYGVGTGNFEDVEYKDLFDNYSDWAERTLIVINEARDTGGIDRYAFYESSKRLIAAPPDTLPCRKMYLGRYYVPNIMAVAITSNNKLNGLYIHPDDRRYYVAWSKVEKAPTSYFDHLWDWMLTGGGKEAVLGYLQRLDIQDFKPMAPPRRTEAWHEIVEASKSTEEKSLADAVEDAQGNRVKIGTVKEFIALAQFGGHLELVSTLTDSKNARKLPHLMNSIGYEPLRNPYAKDGRWVISGRKETLYADRNLSVSECLTLANKRVTSTVTVQ